jgi:hypothetical protein
MRKISKESEQWKNGKEKGIERVLKYANLGTHHLPNPKLLHVPMQPTINQG